MKHNVSTLKQKKMLLKHIRKAFRVYCKLNSSLRFSVSRNGRHQLTYIYCGNNLIVCKDWRVRLSVSFLCQFLCDLLITIEEIKSDNYK